jgi:hypothetical protein
MSKYFTIAQTSRLLGFYIRDLIALNKTGKAPRYVGDGEYIAYLDSDVKEWATINVYAPTIWFDRFDNRDLRTVDRSRLILIDDHYELSEF